MNEPVDWALAERVATRVAARHPGPTIDRSALEASLAHQAVVAEPLVEACTGLRSAHGPATVRVIDRAEWARANVASFRRLLGPVSDQWARRLSERRRPGVGVEVTRRLSAVELGTLLGWVSRRVVGQYDLLVTDGGDDAQPADTVYLVGPNLVGLEDKFGFPPEQFRLWVTLHELTHRAQFTGVPWMRAHYLGLVGEALSMVDVDPTHLLAALRSAVTDRHGTRTKLAEGGLASVVATPAQREALRRIAGLMSLLEGHGDVTMSRAGAELIPAADRFARVLAARRRQTNPLTRTVHRLIGLEAKLDQYEMGARFIAAIEAADGPGVVDRCWVAPDQLPSIDEIRRPELWLGRMGLTGAR